MADETKSTEGKKRMSRLTCSQCEGMLLDAADDLLLPDERTHFDLHLKDCAGCTKLFADIRRGHAWMEMLKDDPPQPPVGLVDRILAQTSGDVAVSHAVMAEVAHGQSLFGHSKGAKVLPFRVPAPQTTWARMVHTVMQPRFAMTAAMAFFSLALTLNIAGVKLSSLRASDLKPANVRKSFWAANNYVVRYYDNLRVVYELESRVREMQRESDTEAPRRGVVQEPQPQQHEQEPERQPNGQPRSSAPRHRDGGADQSTHELYRLVPTDRSTYRATTAPRGEGVQA
jgi:hypothetical protein